MFQRLYYEEWLLYFPIVGFFIFFTIFLAVCFRVMRMPRHDIDRLAALPFDPDSNNDPEALR